MALTKILEYHNQLHPERVIHATDVKTKMKHLCFHTDYIPDTENDFIAYVIGMFEENISL